MKKNKIAGLVVASALLVGASSAAHTHDMVKNTNSNTKTNTKKTNEVLLTSANKQVTKNAMVVNGNNELVLRSSASSNSTIISNISVGEMLTIKSYSSNWYKVTVKETGSIGYISSNNVKFIESGVNYNNIDLNNNGKVINVSSALNLRTEPTLASNVITTLENGTNFRIVASKGQWYQITVNGSTGFVYGGYVNVGSEIKSPTHMSAKKEVISQKTSTTKSVKPVITKSETNNVTKTATNTTTQTKKITNSSSEKVQTTITNTKKTAITPVKVEKTKKVEVKQPEIKTPVASASLTNNHIENMANSFMVIPNNTVKNIKNNDIDSNNTDGKTTDHKDITKVVAKASNDGNISITKKEEVTSNKHKEDKTSKNTEISKSNSTKAKDDASKVINTNLNNNTNTKDTTVKNVSADNSKVTSKKVITPSETPASIVNNKTKNSSNNIVKKDDVSITKNTEPNNNNNNTSTKTTPNTINKHKDVVKQVVQEQGSLTLTMYQTNNDLALANTSITINGENYTTNSNGKVKISNIKAGNHNFNLASQGYNNTSANINIKAGKNMNSIIYITKTVTHDSVTPKIAPTPITKPQAKTTHHDTVIPTPAIKPVENHKTTPTPAPIIKHNDANSQESNSELGQAIVNYAEQFIGRPYVWGATGPNSFDCSGLTYYVYKHFGYYIGCTTYTQIDKGTPVSVNNLQAGDLIFWGDPSAPYHVAIYIGGGQYIQAPHTGATVDISSWNLSNISAARRII